MQIKAAIFGISALGLLSLTNPNKTGYINYAYSQMCDDMGGIEKTACKAFVFSQGKHVKELVDLNTDTKNFIFCSLYTTEFVGFKFQTVALLGNFYTFKK